MSVPGGDNHNNGIDDPTVAASRCEETDLNDFPEHPEGLKARPDER